MDEQTLRDTAQSSRPEALSELADAVRTNPESCAAWKFYGLAAYRRGAYEEAAEHLTRAIALQGSDLETHLFLMRSRWALGDKEGAMSTAMNIADFDPSNLEALRLIARVHHQRQNYPDALRWWKLVAERAPDDHEVALRAARLASRLGHFNLAAEMAQRALSHSSHEAEGLQIAVNALYRSRRFEELLALIPMQFGCSPDHALRMLDKVDPMAYAEAVAGALADIRRDSARRYESHVVEADNRKMSTALVELRNAKSELEAIDAMLATFVGRWHTEAVDCELSGNDLASARLFRAIRIVDPTTARPGLSRLKSPFIELMRTAIDANEPDAALRHARRALQIDPEDVEAQFAVGRVLLLTGQPEEAMAPLLTCVEQEPENDWFWLNYARACARSEHTHPAASAFRRVVELIGDDSPHHHEATKSLWNLYGTCIRRGREAFEAGNLERAWGEASTAATLRPAHEAHSSLKRNLLRSLFLMVRDAYKEGDHAKADMLGQRYASWDDQNVDVFLMLGRTQMRLRNYAAAITTWERVVELGQTDASTHLQIARCAAWLKEPERGLAAARMALELDPSIDEARTILSQLDAETI